MKILGITIALLMLLSLAGCQNGEAIVTSDCTDHATVSLTAHATINRLEAGTLSVRGFVYMEGTTGDPDIAIIPLENPSFELGDPPDGWTAMGGNLSRSTEQVKVGSYSGRMDPRGAQYSRVVQQDIGGAELATSLRGQTVTLGGWLWTSVSNSTRLGILTTSNATWSNPVYGASHAGDSSWHWLTVSKTIEADATGIRIDFPNFVSGSTAVAYADGAILIKGRAVFEQGSFGTGPYSLTIKGLKPGTSYRIRAFAQNEAGIYYGNVITCETLAQE